VPLISLPGLAAALRGRVRRDKTGAHVVAPGPGCKGRDRSLSVWIEGDNLRCHSHRGVGWQECQAYVRQRAALPEWTPTWKAKPAPKRDKRFAGQRVREAMRFLGPRPSAEQFTFLINEARNADATDGQLAGLCRRYGFTAEDLAAILTTPARLYDATDAAKAIGLTYARRQQLRIRTIGAIDLDKAGRERARRDRYNAKRRAERNGGRIRDIIARADAARRGAEIRNRELLSARRCRMTPIRGPLDAGGVNKRYPSSESMDLDQKQREFRRLMELYPNEIEEKVRLGVFLDVKLGEAEDAGDDDDAPHTFVEQHCWYDLDEDGYKEPCIVTYHKQTLKVVRIVARDDADARSSDGSGFAQRTFESHLRRAAERFESLRDERIATRAKPAEEAIEQNLAERFKVRAAKPTRRVRRAIAAEKRPSEMSQRTQTNLATTGAPARQNGL